MHPNGIMRTCSLMIGTPYGIGRYYDDKMVWDDSPTNELRSHKFDENTPCTNQSKNNKFGEFVPTCVSFKPGQNELIWKELEWEKRRIESRENKIRTFISFQDEEINEKVTSSINNSDVAELIGNTKKDDEVVEQIKQLRPDMVFMEYKNNGTNCFEIIKKVNEELKLDIPVFNIIGDNVPREERNEIARLIGSKMNSVIEKNELYENEVKNILKEYKEYNLK